MPNATARKLRRNATDSERRLWSRLRHKQIDGHRFRRQVPLGPYVADFVCLEARLIIEVDGGQHADRNTEDAVRTAWLEGQNFRVLRFWNNDVLQNTDGVIDAIRATLNQPPPTRSDGKRSTGAFADRPRASPARGEGK